MADTVPISDRASSKKFPEGFYWGAATASYQVEGGIENCDWADAARKGIVPVCGRACDHYNRFEEDFDLAQSLGHNCHRLSVEWARIEPEEGRFDEDALEHYRTVVKALHARGMEPFVTLWHFTLPQWFADKGGFEHADAPELFARYAARVVDALDGLCSHYATINEPIVFASNGWIRGTWAPFKRGAFYSYLRVRAHLARAHNRAYDEIKKVRPNVDVGIVMHVIYFHANANPLNKLIAAMLNFHWTHSFMQKVQARCDSIGLNYYIHKKFGDTAVYEKTDMGWDSYPEGLLGALMMLKRYDKSIYIAEAGIADASDSMRAQYIKALVRAVHEALHLGVSIHGFMYWSLLDNYEWALGFEKRFGLIEVNYETQKRTIRRSAYVYKAIIEHNALLE